MEHSLVIRSGGKGKKKRKKKRVPHHINKQWNYLIGDARKLGNARSISFIATEKAEVSPLPAKPQTVPYQDLGSLSHDERKLFRRKARLKKKRKKKSRLDRAERRCGNKNARPRRKPTAEEQKERVKAFYKKTASKDSVTARKYLRHTVKTAIEKGYVITNEGELEHRDIWEKVVGKIPKGWIIHHCNAKKQDNRLDNLIALPRQFHNELHECFGFGPDLPDKAAVEKFKLAWLDFPDFFKTYWRK